MFFKLTSINDPCLNQYTQFNESQRYHIYEPEIGTFIAESSKVIFRALKSGYEPLSLLLSEEDKEKEKNLLVFFNHLPVYLLDENELLKMKGYGLIRGPLCLMRRKLTISSKTFKDYQRIAVLDNIENPGNIGSIFRNAAATGIDALIIGKGCADPLYKRSIRVSMGAVFQIPFIYCDDYISLLHQFHYSTIALALKKDSIPIDSDILKQDKPAIILGNEGEGLSDDILNKCDYKAIIPMYHHTDSLNVAAASAIAFWELRNRRI